MADHKNVIEGNVFSAFFQQGYTGLFVFLVSELSTSLRTETRSNIPHTL